MLVWRGFTLTLWVALLTACTALILLYHALSTTVLDVDKTKDLLARSHTYEVIRDTVLVEQVVTTLSERYPENKLVDRAMVKEVLVAVLPEATLAKRLDPAISSLYRWLDSKEEDISFTISVADKKDSFYRALEAQLTEKLTAIDSCGDYRYPPEDAVLQDLCLPVYVSAKEATQAAMGSIRAGDFPLGDTITDESLFGDKAGRGALNELPTYLNILWTLNLLAIAVLLMTTLFLVITRKSLGVIALGISLVLGGITAWIIGPVVTAVSTTASQASPIAKALSDALITPFITASMNAALLAILSGITITVLAFTWRWQRGRRA